MDSGRQAAFCKAVTGRLGEAGRHPLLVLDDLGVSVDDFVCTLSDDEQFCRDACLAVAVYCRLATGGLPVG
jgi:hypothetical protein